MTNQTREDIQNWAGALVGSFILFALGYALLVLCLAVGQGVVM